MIKTSNAGSVGSIPGQGAKILQASWPKNQNIKQKQNCNSTMTLKNGLCHTHTHTHTHKYIYIQSEIPKAASKALYTLVPAHTFNLCLTPHSPSSRKVSQVQQQWRPGIPPGFPSRPQTLIFQLPGVWLANIHASVPPWVLPSANSPKDPSSILQTEVHEGVEGYNVRQL